MIGKISTPIASATLAVVAAAALVLGRYARLDLPTLLVSVVLMCAWLAIFTLACFGPGSAILRAVGGRRGKAEAGDPLEESVISLAAGSGVLVTIAGALALLGLLRPPLLLAALVILSIWGALALRPRLARLADAWPSHRPRGDAWLPALLVLLAGLPTLLAAATPSPFYDQLHYHLAFPHHWLRSGRIQALPREVFSFFPADMGLLYAYGLSAAGARTAQALHWWMGLLGVAGVAALARRLGGAPAAAWGAGILAVTPALMLLASCASADLAVLAFGTTSWLMVLGALDSAGTGRRWAWWLLSGALAGLALGSKYLALASVVAPIGAGLVVVGLGRLREPRSLGRLAACSAAWALGLALAFAPWAVRNTILTGNPLYPFFGATLAAVSSAAGSDDVASTGAAESAGKIAKTGRARPSLAEVLTLKTFSPRGESGLIGPVYLLLVPAWIVWIVLARPPGPHAMLAAGFLAGVAAWSFGPPLGRYLLPVLALAAAGSGATAATLLAAWTRPVRTLLAALLGFALIWSWQGGFSNVTMAQITCSIGRGASDELMARYASYWPALPVVNETLPPDARLLLVAESRSFAIDREVLVEDPYRSPWLVDLAARASSAAELADAVRALGATHLLYNEHEAGRIARMNGRDDYFGTAGPGPRRIIADFFDTCLSRIDTKGPTTIYAVGGCARAAASPP